MATSITFTLDEEFTEYDLRQLLAYKDMACVLFLIRQKLSRLDRGKEDLPDTAYELLQEIIRIVDEEMKDLPEMG